MYKVIKENNETPKKCRNFTFLMYETELLNDFIDYITFLGGEYAFIYHDKDIFEEDTETHKKGELKKPHYHWIIHFTHQRYVNSIKNALLEKFENKIKIIDDEFVVRSCPNIMLYLTHIKETLKAIYDYSDIVSNSEFLRNQYKVNLKNDYDRQFNEAMFIINEYVCKQNKRIIHTRDIMQFAGDNGMISSYNKYRNDIRNCKIDQERTVELEKLKLENEILNLKNELLDLKKQVNQYESLATDENLPF